MDRGMQMAAPRMTRRIAIISTISALAGCSLALAGCSDDGDDAPADDGAADDGGTTQAADDDDGASSSGGAEPAAVTYWGDVKPLLDGRCVACHREGGIAPFSLETYADAAMWAAASVAAIESGAMPPWPPADGCNSFVGVRELTAEQIGTIATWLELQTPEGDPANEGAPLPDVAPGLSRVDASLPMAQEYTPQQSPDDYRCFLVDWPAEYESTTYVTGFRAVPGDDAIVHHVIAFLATPDQKDAYAELDAAEDGPGYTCFGGTGGPSRTWLGGWAPGSAGTDLPPGLGLEVPAGSQVILQVHYNTASSGPAPDLTSIEFKVDDEVETVANVMPWTNPTWLAPNGMPIPAGEDDVVHGWGRDPTTFTGGPLVVWSAALHMHQLGTSGTLSIERAGGESECLLQIDAWDFHWQGSYGFVDPIRVEPGDELNIECHWDNSAANQAGEPKDAQWGEGTGDEMCLGVFLTAPG
jgi:hypothetical protein